MGRRGHRQPRGSRSFRVSWVRWNCPQCSEGHQQALCARLSGARGGFMKLDLNDFTETLPYASELFGVYQPLLGWRSRLTVQRVTRARSDGYVGMTGQALS